ncbi:DUF1804 family protein [Luteimonas sp. XNQY3]|nr:DUF1804 family protein [Luteimonas sp. XNQY3]MCD9005170.1 DUF1804 family protein [Luteimonas sp. XNQY3]
MAAPGRPPFANVHAIGVREAAMQASERIYRAAEHCCVWILPDGGIVVRRVGHSYKDPGDENLVGVYAPKHRTADLEADIRHHVAAMRAPVKAASKSTHPQYWPADTRTRVRALRRAGRTVATISSTLGVPFGTVRRWVYESQEQAA